MVLMLRILLVSNMNYYNMDLELMMYGKYNVQQKISSLAIQIVF